MRARPLLGVLVVAALGVAGPARALTCPLVADPAGDTVVPDARADITAANLKLTPTALLAAVRVADVDDLAWQPATAVEYAAIFASGAARFWLRLSPDGVPSALRSSNGITWTALPVTSQFDLATESVVWRVARASAPELATAGATLRGLVASTNTATRAQPRVVVGADEARATQSYAEGDPACF